MRIGWKAAVHDPRIASFRYRVVEPVAALGARGHDVEIFSADRVDRYDLVVFSKSYRAADREIAGRVRAAGGRVALDLCDNHFYNPYHLPRYAQARADLLAMIGLADRLIVSTPALGLVVRAEAGLDHDPFVVGDVAERIDLPPRSLGGTRTLLWFGSHGSPNAPSGMEDLRAIAPALAAQARRTPFELVVASNDRDKFERVAPLLGVPARYVAWTHEGFPELLAAADGVVIPLSDNPFVACKTHNRITTALWPGVPVVADTIESYAEFADFAWLGDWAGGLQAVLEEPERARARAARARAHIDRHWTMAALAPLWEQALGLPTSTAITAATAPAVAPSSAPVPDVRPVAEAEPSRVRGPAYQAALDLPEADRVTGWARVIARPGRRVRVTLEEHGAIVAEATAELDRPDLAAVGFAHSACGFALDVPDAWRDGEARRFSVVADGTHLIEALSAAFRPGEARPRASSGRARGSRAERARPSARAPHAPDDPRHTRDGVRLQKLLADELEVLTAAVEHVRSVAARIVLAAAAGPPDDRPLEFGQGKPDVEGHDDAGPG